MELHPPSENKSELIFARALSAHLLERIDSAASSHFARSHYPRCAFREIDFSTMGLHLNDADAIRFDVKRIKVFSLEHDVPDQNMKCWVIGKLIRSPFFVTSPRLGGQSIIT